MNLPYKTLDLDFNFAFDCKRVFDWWTELEPSGYVGRTLKKIEVLENSGVRAKVRTQWEFLGIGFSLVEELEVRSEREWVWRSRFLGVPAVETFTLTPREGGCGLHIHSEMTPGSVFRKTLFLLIGWYWRREDRREWVSAAQACVRELGSKK
jgi:hypothetical protein